MKLLVVLIVIVVGVDSKLFVQEWFNKADLNQNSVLSFEEAKSSLLPKLSGFLGRNSALPVDEKLVAIWNKLDTDGNREVDFGEFKSAANKLFEEYTHKKDLITILQQLKTVGLK
jgi:hypothetical protein